MLDCKQASRLLSDQQEHRLALGARIRLRLHLWICAECRRFERQLGALRRALRQADADPGCCTHHALPDPARRRIKQRLKQAHSDDQPHRL